MKTQNNKGLILFTTGSGFVALYKFKCQQNAKNFINKKK